MTCTIAVQFSADSCISLPITKAVWQTERNGKPSQIRFWTPILDPVPDLGSPVQMQIDDQPVFTGFIFSVEQSSTHQCVLAYDQIRYLLFKDSYILEQKSASQIVSLICADMGLRIGSIESTGFLMDLVFEEKKLIDMINEALQRTLENTGVSYVLWDDQGSLCLNRQNSLQSGVAIEKGCTLIRFAHQSSIDSDTYNRIKLAQKDKKKSVYTVKTVQDDQSVGKWGNLQYYDRVDEKLTSAQISAQAASLLQQKNRATQSLTLEAIGEPNCRAGFLLSVDLGSGIQSCRIDRAVHQLEGARYTMTIEVTRFL